MTKYSYLTNEELLRQWDSLEPLYLLEEVRHRFEYLLSLEHNELHRREQRQHLFEGEEE